MHFQPYVGQQGKWQTTPGGVPELVNGVEIYRDGAFPPRPYEIMGRMTVIYDTRQVEQPTTQVANAAKLKGADGAIVVGTDFKRSTLIGYYDLFRYKR
jgi:hypothetical protein